VILVVLRRLSPEMNLELSIGGEELRLVASAGILDAVARHYGSFAASAPHFPSLVEPITLEIRGRPDRFTPVYERPIQARARESAPGEVTLEGGMLGWYSTIDRLGHVEDARSPAEVDALLRIALSLSLPLRGALLLHGAALRARNGRSIALCGASGSGKSTAATALGAYCDELVVLRRAGGGLELHSTPYWTGRPHRGACAAVVCLARGGEPEFVPLRGAAAARALTRQVVRYVAIERIDRVILDHVCSIGAREVVRLAVCPEGKTYVPFLAGKLEMEEAVG